MLLIFARISFRCLRTKLLLVMIYSAVKKRASCAKHEARSLMLRYLVGEDHEIRIVR